SSPEMGGSRNFAMGGSFVTGSNGFTPHGIPPSLTSITPNFGQTRAFVPNDFGGRLHHFHHRFKNFVPVFYPVYSYYPYYPYHAYFSYGDSSYYSDTTAQMNNPEPEDTRPALTIFENRPGYRPPPVDRSYSDARDYARSESSKAADESSKTADL